MTLLKTSLHVQFLKLQKIVDIRRIVNILLAIIRKMSTQRVR